MYLLFAIIVITGISWTNEPECGIMPAPSGGRRLLDAPETAGIVRGNGASLHEYPWMVSVHRPGFTHFCGASIIKRNVILTAAHCLENTLPADVVVTVGDHDLSTAAETTNTKTHTVSQVILHPQYSPQTTENDIALLILTTPITYSDHVHSVCMPDASDEFPFFQDVTVTGWGALDDGGRVASLLQEVVVEMHNHDYCKIFYGFTYDEDSMICANRIISSDDTVNTGLDSCQGDSGGPLVYENPSTGRWEQLGVVSWGYGCANALAPGIYSHVEKYLDWLTANAGMCDDVAQCEATCSSWTACMMDEPCTSSNLNCANAPAICTGACKAKRACLSTWAQTVQDCTPVICPANCVDSWIGDNYCDSECVEKCPKFTDDAGVTDGGDCNGRSALDQALDYIKNADDTESDKFKDARAIVRNTPTDSCVCPDSWVGDDQCDTACAGCDQFWSGGSVETGSFDGGDCGQTVSTICEACFGANEVYVMGECARGTPFNSQNWMVARQASECPKAKADTETMLDCVAATDCASCTAANSQCQWSAKADVCVSKYITSPGDLTRTCTQTAAPTTTQAQTTTRTPSTTRTPTSTTRRVTQGSSGAPETTSTTTKGPNDDGNSNGNGDSDNGNTSGDEVISEIEEEAGNGILAIILGVALGIAVVLGLLVYCYRKGKSSTENVWDPSPVVISNPTLNSVEGCQTTAPVFSRVPPPPPQMAQHIPGAPPLPQRQIGKVQSPFLFQNKPAQQPPSRGLPPPPVRRDLW